MADFGLIAQPVDPITERHIRGQWYITSRGVMFVNQRDEPVIPKSVTMYNNQVVGMSLKMISFNQACEELKGEFNEADLAKPAVNPTIHLGSWPVADNSSVF